MSIEIFWPEVTRVSHSRLRTWRRCQMQHHYKYYQGLQKRTKQRPLYLGSAVHTLIEAQIQRGTFAPELKEFKREYSKLFQEEKALLGDIPVIANQLVEGYFEHYEQDSLIYVPRRRGRATEIKVYFEIEPGIEFIGYIDAMPSDDEGRVWYMDHKTCKTVPDEETRFSDLQLLFYCWAAPKLGFPKADGVVWDYIRTKLPSIPEVLKAGGISKRKDIDTTYEIYMATVVEHLGKAKAKEYEEFARTLKGKEDRFYRRIYLPSPNKTMINNMVNDLVSTAKEIKMLGPKAKIRNMNRDCKSCSYYTLCHAEVRGMDTDYLRKAEYTVKEDHVEKEIDQQSNEEDGE